MLGVPRLPPTPLQACRALCLTPTVPSLEFHVKSTWALSIAAAVLIMSSATAQLAFSSSIAGTFDDIQFSGGTSLGTASDDSEHNFTATIGNALLPAGPVRVGNNGAAVWGITTGDVGFTNAAIPATGLPSGIPSGGDSALLPWWDDLFPSTAQTGALTLWFKEDVPNGVLTIMWKNEDHFSATGTGTITVELKVFATGPVFAQFLYPDAEFTGPPTLAAQDRAGSATIGYIKGSNASACPTTANLQFSFNQQVIQNGTVLSLVQAPGFGASATATPSGLNAGSSTLVSLNLGCGALFPATATADISSLVGSPTTVPMNDNGGGNFSVVVGVPLGTPPGNYAVPISATDSTPFTANTSVTISVRPDNDDCANAIAIADGPTTGTNVNATTQAGLPTSLCASGPLEVWYTYTNPLACAETVTASLCGGATFDTVIRIYSGTCGSFTNVACNDDFCALQSQLTFTAAPLTTYYVAVGSFSTTTGPFTLTMTSHTAVSQQFGTACGTLPPALNGTVPFLGQNGTLSITGADANAPGIIFAAPPGGAPTPLGGTCNLYLQQGGLVLFLLANTDALGAWSFTGLIPNDPLLDCFPLDLQAIMLGSGGFAASNGLHLVLGH